jgi:WD40 repeat protein
VWRWIGDDRPPVAQPTAVAQATAPATVAPTAAQPPATAGPPVATTAPATAAAVTPPDCALPPLPLRCTVLPPLAHGDVWALAFRQDGQRLVSTSRSDPPAVSWGVRSRWDVNEDRQMTVYRDPTGPMLTVSWDTGDTKDRLVAFGSWDRTMIYLWNALTGVPMTIEPLRGHTKGIWSVAWAPCGTYLASGSDDATIRLWTPPHVGPTDVMPNVSRPAFAVAWRPDNTCNEESILAGGLDNGSVVVWATNKGRFQNHLRTLTGHGGEIRALAWSPDGRFLASGSADRTVRLWDTGTWTAYQLAPQRQHAEKVRAVAWSRDGQLLASGAEDGVVNIWWVRDGQPTLNSALPGTRKPVYALDWAQDDRGDVLAIGGQDQQIELVRVSR